MATFDHYKLAVLGPTLEKFALDLCSDGLASSWNKRAIDVFVDGFIDSGEYESTDRGAIRNAFKIHLSTLKSHHLEHLASNNVNIEDRNLFVLGKRDTKTKLSRVQRRRGVRASFCSLILILRLIFFSYIKEGMTLRCITASLMPS